MAPKAIVHCIRHAQGWHNVAEDYSHRDPHLTPFGQQQCHDIRRDHFLSESKISLITASPLIRTLHTAYLLFEPVLAEGDLRIIALPDAQETSDFPCDTGSDLPDLQAHVDNEGWPVDLDLVDERWNIKTLGSRHSPSSKAVMARARNVRRFLKSKADELLETAESEDVHIVLVTHGGFLHFLTNDWEDSVDLAGTAWRNCETRSYVLQPGIGFGSDDVHLIEIRESRERRGKQSPAPSLAEQQLLFAQTMNGWELQGLPNPLKISDPKL